MSELLRSVAFLASLSMCACGGDISPPSDTAVLDFFKQNRAEVYSFVQFCEENTDVRVIGESPGETTGAWSSAYPEDTAVESIRALMNKMNVKALSCTHDGSLPTTPLISVVIQLYRKGTSFSSTMSGIIFFTTDGSHIEDAQKRGELKSLGEQGWYMYSL